ILREDGNAPVVTCGTTVESGAESGIVGLRCEDPDLAMWGWYSPGNSLDGRSYPYAGTTRIRFEGFARPTDARTSASQPLPGAPLGSRDYSPRAGLPSSRAQSRVRAGRADALTIELRMAVKLDIRPRSGAIGAEIFGVDLAKELDDETVAAIRRVWLDHLVIFFRDQELPPT